MDRRHVQNQDHKWLDVASDFRSPDRSASKSAWLVLMRKGGLPAVVDTVQAVVVRLSPGSEKGRERSVSMI